MVCVDDMLVAAEETVMKGFMDWLQQEWKIASGNGQWAGAGHLLKGGDL